ncbi:hypothetical protein EDD27_10087 [Nonomuraea polychroma]|uniref:Uncharacterized protein n=1 Tax=Nonomuraea polychroma TaxID=46176 RepID=A0A438MNU7_9ACTN|nr:hypothetical protein [Nonomuraea polychroma]RVX47165.1 hypothetical protein EDD27_10087 [Nonomuraea polychroma]
MPAAIIVAIEDVADESGQQPHSGIASVDRALTALRRVLTTTERIEQRVGLFL